MKETFSSHEVDLLKTALAAPNFSVANKLLTPTEKKALQIFVQTKDDAIIGQNTWRKMHKKAKELHLDPQQLQTTIMTEIWEKVKKAEALSEVRKLLTKTELMLLQSNVETVVDGIRGKNTEKKVQHELNKLLAKSRQEQERLAQEKRQQEEARKKAEEKKKKKADPNRVVKGIPSSDNPFYVEEEREPEAEKSNNYQQSYEIKTPEGASFSSNFSSSLERQAQDPELKKLEYQQQRRQRYQQLASPKKEHISELQLFAKIKDLLGAEYALGGMSRKSLDCSSFIACGQGLIPFGKGRETVATLEKKVRVHASPQTLQPGDVVIRKSQQDGNHIEYVAEPARYDATTQSRLIKTLGSAMSTQAFDAEGKKLLTPKSLAFEEKVKKGYGVGYRVREFRKHRGVFYRELADESHSTAEVKFASFGKRTSSSREMA